MEIVVVTKVPEDENIMGNLAMVSTALYMQTEQPLDTNHYRGKYQNFNQFIQSQGGQNLALMMLLNMRSQVFSLGEILFLDEGGREVLSAYGGRKPDKWDITVTTVVNIHDAIALSNKVVEEAYGI